jgi:hypothetical protein
MKTSILAAAIVASALSAPIVSAQDMNGPEGGPGGMMTGLPRAVPVVRVARWVVPAVPREVRVSRGRSDIKARLKYANRYAVPCRGAVNKRTASSPAGR